MDKPLMPRATAAWLVDHTSLSFEQIANFCALPFAEIQGIADGEVAVHTQAKNPVLAGELTQEEIERCQADPSAHLRMRPIPFIMRDKERKGGRYTPLIKRQNKPDGIAWLLKYHPELNDQQIMSLLGTTRLTIESIRNRTHRSMQHLKPSDPVILGLCSQTALNQAVEQAKKMRRSEGDSVSDETNTSSSTEM